MRADKEAEGAVTAVVTGGDHSEGGAKEETTTLPVQVLDVSWLDFVSSLLSEECFFLPHSKFSVYSWFFHKKKILHS